MATVRPCPLRKNSGTRDFGARLPPLSAAAFSVTAAQAGSDATAINAVMNASGANASAVLCVNGTGNGDTVDVSTLAHATNIDLSGNSASVLVSSGIAFLSGPADRVTLGSAASPVHYTAGQGVEVISGFLAGTHVLDWALSDVDASGISATDVTFSSMPAVAITEGGDSTHGVILLNPGISAQALVDDHLFTAGSHGLIT